MRDSAYLAKVINLRKSQIANGRFEAWESTARMRSRLFTYWRTAYPLLNKDALAKKIKGMPKQELMHCYKIYIKKEVE